MKPLLLFLLLFSLILVLGALPAHIARLRRHANPYAVGLCGWVGILIPPLWVIGLLWACLGSQRPDDPAGPRGFEPL